MNFTLRGLRSELPPIGSLKRATATTSICVSGNSRCHIYSAFPTVADRSATTQWAIPPVRLGLSGRNSGKIPERPRKGSQSVSWNFPREYGWDAPNPIISRHLRLPERDSRILSPPVRLGTPLFSELVPERASQTLKTVTSLNKESRLLHFPFF